MSAVNLPKGWIIAPLEVCVDILDAQRIPVNNDERMRRISGKSESELFPYYGATGVVGLIDEFLFDEELVALGEDGVPFFDAQKNKAYILKGKSWVNNHAHVLRAITGLSLNKFLLHYLNVFDYQGFVNGGTRLKLTQANMRRIPLPLPPLAEQQQIAAKLDELLAQVDSLKTRLDAIPKILKRFRQSVLAAAVSGKLTEDWETVNQCTLDAITTKITDGEHLTPETIESGVPLLSAKDIQDNIIYFNNCKFLERSVADKALTRCDPRKNDILIVSRGATVGRTHLVRINTEFCLMGSVLLIRPNFILVTPEYLTIFFKSPLGQKQLIATSGSSAQQAIYIRDVKKMELLLPSIPTQIEVVNRAEQLFAYADQIEQRVKDAQSRVNHLTQSILAKAFRGELTAEWREQNPDLISGENSAEALLARIQAERNESLKNKSNRKKTGQ